MPNVDPTGFASTNAFGTATVTTSASLTITPTGIGSGEAFGTPTVTNGQLLLPVGIGSGEAFGTAVVTRSGAETITLGAGSLYIILPATHIRVTQATGGTSGAGFDVERPPVSGGSEGSFFVSFTAAPRLEVDADLSADGFKRSLLKTNITMPTPAIISGRPVLPQMWMKNDSTMNFTVGASNIRAITPPVPVVTHPGGGGSATQYTWTVDDLVDPPGDHGHYNLPVWREHSGGPEWRSTGVYMPRVADVIVYGADGDYHTYDKSVHFDATNVEHMWIDLGTHHQPFTWVFCGMINYYPQRTYGHYMLDAGKATPTRDTDRDWKIDEGMSYRSLMLYQSSSAVIATHTGRDAVASGKHVRGPHNDIARPRVFIGVFNGANSFIGSYDRYNKYGKVGVIDDKVHRHFVMGRRQNNISDNLASHMTMFEIRFFNQALSQAERVGQYQQLAAKWEFNKYGSGL